MANSFFTVETHSQSPDRIVLPRRHCAAGGLCAPGELGRRMGRGDQLQPRGYFWIGGAGGGQLPDLWPV